MYCDVNINCPNWIGCVKFVKYTFKEDKVSYVAWLLREQDILYFT